MRTLTEGKLITSAIVFYQLASGAAGRVPVPVSVLQQQADAIVVATISQLVDPKPALEIVQLQVQQILKGHITATNLSVQLMPSPTVYVKPGVLPASAVGQKGVWFLQLGIGGYQAMPFVNGVVTEHDFFFPNNDPPNLAAPIGTINQQLLMYVIRWYLSLANPSGSDDALLFNNTEADPQDALVVLNELISASSPAHHAVGLAASIQLGSDAAISALATELSSLGSNPKLFQILTAIGQNYKLDGSASITSLQQLIGPGIPGMDAAVAAALRKISTRQVAPLMAQLLSSPDTDAQRRAAAFFGYYSLFADKSGNIADANLTIGPFATADTRAYTPRSNSSLSAAQYAEFWKTWWFQNKSSLGFSAP